MVPRWCRLPLSLSVRSWALRRIPAQQKLVITGPAGHGRRRLQSPTPSGGNWLKISPTSGSSLPDPSVSGSSPVVFVDPTGLAIGTYTGTIAVTTTGGTQNVSVSLSVVAGAILIPNPGTLSLARRPARGTQQSDRHFRRLRRYLESAIDHRDHQYHWIKIVSSSSAFVTIGVDQTGLTTGSYTGSISVTQAGAANSPVNVPVVLVVNGGGSGGGGSLSFSPSSMSFSSINGCHAERPDLNGQCQLFHDVHRQHPHL